MFPHHWQSVMAPFLFADQTSSSSTVYEQTRGCATGLNSTTYYSKVAVQKISKTENCVA